MDLDFDDEDCAICLNKLNNKSRPDNCRHSFCFKCLKEWAQTKLKDDIGVMGCPLCRQSFTFIFHKMESDQNFKVYHPGLKTNVMQKWRKRWTSFAERTEEIMSLIKLRLQRTFLENTF